MKRLIPFVAAVCFLFPPSLFAADLVVAQAANFMPAMEEIIPAFKAKTGLSVQVTYASTGKLFGQILHGAPYDLFFAADQHRPHVLFSKGLCSKPFTYAKGRVVLWTKRKELCSESWCNVLRSPVVAKIAIANTENAPYGASAMKALKEHGLWDSLQAKLVYGQSIAQVFQFAYTGAADVGLCAYSSVFTKKGAEGTFLPVPEAPAIVQAGCVLKNAPHGAAAHRFVAFLASDQVAAIKKKYGYE